MLCGLILALPASGARCRPPSRKRGGAPPRHSPALPADRPRDRRPAAWRSWPTLIEAVRVMRFAGLNITSSACKQLVMPLLDELSEERRYRRGQHRCAPGRSARRAQHRWRGLELGVRRILPARRPSRVSPDRGQRGRIRRAPTPCSAWARPTHDRRSGRAAAAALAARLNAFDGDHRASASPDLRGGAGAAPAPHPRDADRDGERAGAGGPGGAAPARCGCRTSSTCRSETAVAEGRAAHRCADRGRRAHERRAGAPRASRSSRAGSLIPRGWTRISGRLDVVGRGALAGTA